MVQEVSSGAPRALLVLPEGAMAQSILDTLTRERIEATCVSNVFQAVSAYTREPADIVILGLKDLTEQDLKAIKVFREVRADSFILVAFPAVLRDRAVRALAHGADAYILEPFYPGEFLDIIRRALSRFMHNEEHTASGDDLERMAGAVAHAINNPLQILELVIEASESDSSETEELRAPAQRIKHVVEELLAFVTRTQVNPQNIDLNELIRTELPALVKERKVEFNLSPDLPLVFADPGGMRTVIRAFAVLGAPGTLNITTGLETDGKKRFSVVCFNAPDLILSATEAEAFFTPFAGPASGEVGLAVATAKAVIEHHGGLVEFLSREGVGTRVMVALPLR